jgi:hypothetical protein
MVSAYSTPQPHLPQIIPPSKQQYLTQEIQKAKF